MTYNIININNIINLCNNLKQKMERERKHSGRWTENCGWCERSKRYGI